MILKHRGETMIFFLSLVEPPFVADGILSIIQHNIIMKYLTNHSFFF
jgi:hypothetical protein